MLVEAVNAVKSARTRKKRHKKAQEQETKRCRACRVELTWRDAAYSQKDTTMCKVCHGKDERKRLRGAPVPAARLPQPTMSYGAAQTLTLAKRPRAHSLGYNARKTERFAALLRRPKAEPPDPAKRHKTRAERRYAQRQAKKAQVAA